MAFAHLKLASAMRQGGPMRTTAGRKPLDLDAEEQKEIWGSRNRNPSFLLPRCAHHTQPLERAARAAILLAADAPPYFWPLPAGKLGRTCPTETYVPAFSRWC